MAIYYLDPFAATNGTGTWASPWNLGTAHTGVATGDEVRIKGVALTSLLTATSYTATVTSNTTLTITAGGGLGADWAVGNMGYLPAYDTFFRVLTVVGNAVSVYASSVLPINDSSVTSVTLRKVDTATYVFPSIAIGYLVGDFAAVSNITVSDCWTDAVTRVTDGTVKTVLSTITSSSFTLSLDTTTRSTAATCSGWAINLDNTHIISGGVTTGAAAISCLFYADNSTYTIKQTYSTVASGGVLNVGTTGAGSTGSTLTITHLSGAGFSTCYSHNFTATIQNCYVQYPELVFNTTSFTSSFNYNVTFNYIGWGAVNSGYILFGGSFGKGAINLNGITDCWNNNTLTGYFGNIYGYVAINISSTYSVKYNKKANTQTTFSRGFGSLSNSNSPGKMIIPVFTAPTGVTVTSPYAIATFSYASGTTFIPKDYMQPLIMQCDCPANIPAVANLPNSFSYGVNVLLTYRDGSDPMEILGPTSLANTNITATNCPQVTKDATVYRTVGPSLKSYLSTRTTNYWRTSTTAPNAVAVKNIKIPVTSGLSYTVSGYVRTDDTAYVSGDCRVAIIFNNAELIGQNMTTSCINAWEGFSLTFTASQTCEMIFAWEMYYENGAKAYWLDDLTIT